ncbi:Det1 complexing ubiquitin ligase family protein [Acanthocheilonema viteae]
MSIANFLKDLPSRDKANFSSFLKQNGKPVVARISEQSDDEKRIIFDMKPLLLRYLQSNWGNSPTCSTSSARSDRKRASDVSSNATDESENTSGTRIKTRRRE